MTLIDQLREKTPFLTRKQRDVVACMLEDPERMSYITLKELSLYTCVTETTVLKTCSLLGFPSFSALKYEFRKFAAQQRELFRHQYNEYPMQPAPSYELAAPERLFQEICNEEARLTALFFQELDAASVFRAADMVLAAGTVVLCGRGVSMHICDYLAMRLSTLGRGTVTVNSELDDSVHAALPLMDSSALLIAVSFPDYYRMTTKVAQYARRRNCPVLGLTDAPHSPIFPLCGLALTAPTQTRMFLNTISAPMALANLLTTAVYIRLSEQNIEFGADIEAFYNLFPEREH